MPSRGAGPSCSHYDGTELDASLLMIPRVGFLPPTGPRVVSTVDAIQRELCTRGLVRPYIPAGHVDGLPGGRVCSRRARSGSPTRC
jgi:GH15 family glucan-1,4-alpha-glucosidase